jgi:flagellar biosynthetic protein FlhB
MSEDSGQDKSHDASAEKLRKARKKGNIPLSTDLAVFASYAGLLVGLSAIAAPGAWFGAGLAAFFWHPDDISGWILGGSAVEGRLSFVPLLALLVLIGPAAIAVIVGLIGQQGIVFAPTKIKPDLKRINPVEGMKRKYGTEGLGEFAKSAVKITLVAAAGGAWLWSRRDHYLGLLGQPAAAAPAHLLQEIVGVVAIGCAIALLVALVDLPAKRGSHARKLRMTRQEVTDEHKELEGDPTQKHARKRRAQELSRNRQLQDVQTADVVIVNPTHYAVALRWDRAADTAPTCVAKGVDHFALALIDRARTSGVPVREDPPCARALHATVDVGETIRPEHYAAVAAAIRFADGVRATLS